MIQKPKRRERFLAFLIDVLLFLPFTFVMNWLNSFSVAFYPITLFAIYAVSFWYYVNYQYKHGDTIGKRKFGLKLISINGLDLTYIQCVKKYLNYNLIFIFQLLVLLILIPSTPNDGFSKLPLAERMSFFHIYNRDYVRHLEYVGYIWLFVNLLFFLFDKQGRTRADYFAGTMVGKMVEDEIETIGKVDPV